MTDSVNDAALRDTLDLVDDMLFNLSAYDENTSNGKPLPTLTHPSAAGEADKEVVSVAVVG
jgi:hypothetical protein